ncbi:substrate-binding domain-containing protein [Muricomes intestini]|jgi:ribose transport system substrate-binding protein|uniref:Monosaccharide ABC transporter substrate-binding protein (CUT2 family) n=1 Tax=Muricomes intestini TaxID=1796634 RepID=A0A4R3KDG3_9FIRM|nr:substrate-binding domain-containing protein [Muricomes intestini]TCS81135.1 monosaccharide ABC transporter substrate-binding protein (CUT2 family) [Muricomes intestini]HAX52053.1 LacI family transcriptional regulator [Lachnospiraceae bacterium]
MKKKLLSILLCTAMVATLAVGCGGSDKDSKSEDSTAASGEDKGSGDKLKVGIAMKTQDGPYFVTLAKSVQEKCAEIGLVDKASDVVVLNADMDVAKQSENFETFISQNYDLIFCDCIDPDNVIADEKAAYDAGIPVINIDSGVNDGSYCVTTVYSDNEQNGRLCGQSFAESMGDEEIYGIMLSGEKGNVAGNQRRQGLICGILEKRLGITEDEAWKLTKEADEQLLNKGSYTNEDAKFTIAGQGWGNWTVNDILNDANDLVVKTKDKLNTMFGENDQMLFGGMQAADDAGLTGIHYVAAADGAKEAYDYINGTTPCKSGEYYCTGENSPVQVAITATDIAKKILVDGSDPDSYEEVTMTEAVCITKDNVDERYDYGF